jgi:putative flavoprotein involved in K+ transport
MMDRDPGTRAAVVVGAGPGGLAAGAMLRRRGVDALLLDRFPRVGDSWRRRYDRLHLHTIRSLSNLPGLAIPWSEGRWVSRDGVARYLEAYARHHGLEVLSGTEAVGIDRSDGTWGVRTTGPTLQARHVVVATGDDRTPYTPAWPGLEDFPGEILHSSSYRNAEPFRGQDVLVAGTGNSGAEIAVDLFEGGAASVRIAVRTPPNIVPRVVLGIPTQMLGIVLRRFPPAVADALGRNTQRIAVGDLAPYGFPRPALGVYSRHRRDGIIPILDIGLIRLLKTRKVHGVAAVERFEGSDVVLADGDRLQPEYGYRRDGFPRRSRRAGRAPRRPRLPRPPMGPGWSRAGPPLHRVLPPDQRKPPRDGDRGQEDRPRRRRGSGGYPAPAGRSSRNSFTFIALRPGRIAAGTIDCRSSRTMRGLDRRTVLPRVSTSHQPAASTFLTQLRSRP